MLGFIIVVGLTLAAVGLFIYFTKVRNGFTAEIAASRAEEKALASDRHHEYERGLLQRDQRNMEEARRFWVVLRRLVAVGIFACAIALIAMSISIVPTRNIAVAISFGKPTGTMGNGFHVIAPWQSVETYDAAIQTLKLDGDDPADATPAPIVRLANAATARVDVTVQWQVDPDADITRLHLDYRNFDNIQDNVVRRQLQAALNAVFEKYDPLLSLKGGQQQTTLAQLAEQVHAQLSGLLPKGVIVRSVIVPLIRFDPKVQEALDKYQQTIAETQIAEQREKTNLALKRANDILASANNTAGVLYQNCLEMTERMAQQGKGLPAAWSCGVPPTAVVPVR